MIKYLTLVCISLVLSGCSVSPLMQSGIADSATTYTAIKTGSGFEANGLLPVSAVGASLVSLGATAIVNKYASSKTKSTLCRVKFGVAGNNLSVILGVNPALGVASAITIFFATNKHCNR